MSYIIKNVPLNFKDQMVPLTSYTYTKPIAVMILNYEKELCDLQLANFKSKLPACLFLFALSLYSRCIYHLL